MDHLDDSLLNEYLDQVLSVDARLAADVHLGSCPVCRTRLEDLQRLLDRLVSLPEARLSHDLTLGVLSQLPHKEHRHLQPVYALQAVLAFAAILWFSTRIVWFQGLPFLAFPTASLVAGFRLYQLTLNGVNRLFSNFDHVSWMTNFQLIHQKVQLPHLPEHLLQLNSLHPQLLMDKLPVWQYPFSQFSSLLILFSIFMIWLIGNGILLRSDTQEKK